VARSWLPAGPRGHNWLPTIFLHHALHSGVQVTRGGARRGPLQGFAHVSKVPAQARVLDDKGGLLGLHGQQLLGDLCKEEDGGIMGYSEPAMMGGENGVARVMLGC